jgi:hypothetical protein
LSDVVLGGLSAGWTNAVCFVMFDDGSRRNSNRTLLLMSILGRRAWETMSMSDHSFIAVYHLHYIQVGKPISLARSRCVEELDPERSNAHFHLIHYQREYREASQYLTVGGKLDPHRASTW